MERIACIITVVHRDLDVRVFQKQARSLARAGWRVSLVAPSDVPEREVDGVRILGLPRAPRWRRPLNWGRALWRALRSGADVYHIHDPELLLIAPILGRLSGKPVIYDVHEDYRLSILEKPWIPAPLRSLSGRLFDWLESRLVRAVSAVAFVTPPIGERYTRWGVRSAQIANYAMLSEYPGEPLEMPEGGGVVCVGGMTAIRGYDELLEAFALVSRRMPEARLLLVGAGDSQGYEDHLRRKARLLGIGDAVQFIGRVAFEEVRAVLARASVAVLPYQAVPAHLVAYPTKLFEYMAAGVPCVCSDLPLCREIVETSGCGVVVDARCPRALSDAIIHLLHHPREAAEMGRRGREAFLAHYTWEGEAAKLLALYDQLCPQRESDSA